MASRGNVLESCHYLSDFLTGVKLSGTEHLDARFQATHIYIWKKIRNIYKKIDLKIKNKVQHK
jgi:hypothetical protein